MEKPINPTPKQRFCANAEFRIRHTELIANESFGRGLDYAKLELMRRLCIQPDGEFTTAMKYSMLSGAEQFTDILLKLATTVPEPSPRKDLDNLKG